LMMMMVQVKVSTRRTPPAEAPAPALSPAEEQQQKQRLHQRVQQTLDRTTLASRERIKVPPRPSQAVRESAPRRWCHHRHRRHHHYLHGRRGELNSRLLCLPAMA
jgi:hypothetical protein